MIKAFFNEILIKYKRFFKEDIVEVIQLLIRDKDELEELKDQKEHDKQESDKKRKERIQAKKKEKQMTIKQNQEKIMKKFNF